MNTNENPAPQTSPNPNPTSHSKTRIVLLLVGIVAVCAILAGLFRGGGQTPQDQAAPPPSARQTLTIGIILPQTGYTAYIGDAVKKGMDLAASQINAAPDTSIAGVRLLYEDSAEDNTKAVTAFRKLTTVDRVPVVVCVSTGAKPLTPLAAEQKTVLFCTVNSSSGVAAASPWVFRFFINADTDARMIADYAARKLALRKAGIVYLNDEFGVSYRDVFTRTFQANGGTVVGAESFGFADADFKPAFLKLKNAGPDCVYMLAYANNMAQLPLQMRQVGLNAQILSIGTISQWDIIKQAGDAVEGAVYTTNAFETEDPATPELQAFVRDYQARHQKVPEFFEVFGFDTVNILASVAGRSGTSSEAIRSGLHQVKDLPAACGSVTVDSDGEVNFPVVIKKIEGGKRVFVE